MVAKYFGILLLVSPALLAQGRDPYVAAPVLVRMQTQELACNRSNKAWPGEPIRIAVLDFQYPTTKASKPGLRSAGEGPGAEIADLIVERMAGDRQIVFVRGDRHRVDFDDFSGAASLGRRLGVDAVLAGGWEADRKAEPGVRVSLNARPAKNVPLRLSAGLIDTCTGELLLRLTSDACATGTCKSPLTLADALNPARSLHEVSLAINQLVSPLEAGAGSSGGVVTQARGNMVTVQLPQGARVGAELPVRAERLGKNSTTYTLHTLRSEQIGRVVVARVSGSTATGQFSGDYAPAAGDMVGP